MLGNRIIMRWTNKLKVGSLGNNLKEKKNNKKIGISKMTVNTSFFKKK